MKTHIAYLAEWTDPQPGLAEIMAAMDRFVMAWSGTWARYGPSNAGLPAYLRHLKEVHTAITGLGATPVKMRNGQPLLASAEQFIFKHAIGPAAVQDNPQAPVRTPRRLLA